MWTRMLNAKLVVFYWDDETARLADELECILEYTRMWLPVSALSIDAQVTAVSFSCHALEDNAVGCVLLLSRNALDSPALPAIIEASLASLARRREFRLFVHLHGLSRDEFLERAERLPFLKDLLDTVNLPEHFGSAAWDEVVAAVKSHVKALPDIYDRIRLDRIRTFAFRLVPLADLLFAVLFFIGLVQLALRGEPVLRGPWGRWILFLTAFFGYGSVISLLSLGSPLTRDLWVRSALAAFPLFTVGMLRLAVMRAYWPHIVAGFLCGMIADTLRRQYAAHSRRSFRLEVGSAAQALPAVGAPSWTIWTSAPLLGTEPHVFVSYSRASVWGREMASSLQRQLSSVGVPSFLDVEGIATGVSWRDRLEEALGRATIVISIQDAATASRVWPTAELAVAAKSQSYCGLPSIIVLRDSGLDALSVPAPVRKLLFPEGAMDPTFLSVIDATPETASFLAQGLKWHDAFCLVGGAPGRLLYLALGLVRIVLAMVGALAPPAGLVLAAAWVVWRGIGGDPRAWLDEHGLTSPLVLLVAFWIGFLLRLVFAARFELKSDDPLGVLLVPLWSLASLCLLLARPLYPANELTLLYGAVLLVLGLMLSSDITASLRAAGRLPAPPA